MKKRNNLKIGPVFASQIKKLRKRFCWVDQPLHGSVLTPISCTKLKIHSAHADKPGFQTHFHAPWFTSENCMKKRNNLQVGPVSTSQIKKLRKRCCWVAQPLLGQYFHPSPVQVSRSLRRVKTVLLLKKKSHCFKGTPITEGEKWSLSSKEKKTNIILNLQGVFPSQIKKVRKRFCWVDQPLSRPGHTPIPCTKHNIYKVQTVLAVRRKYFDQWEFTVENICIKNSTIWKLSQKKTRWTMKFKVKNLDLGTVFASKIIKLRKRFC